jgi:hypothetical protein
VTPVDLPDRFLEGIRGGRFPAPVTEARYLEDSYRRSCESVVSATGGGGIVLDRTVFYPGGGQPADPGELAGAAGERWRVVSVDESAGRIVHHLEPANLPKSGPGCMRRSTGPPGTATCATTPPSIC